MIGAPVRIRRDHPLYPDMTGRVDRIDGGTAWVTLTSTGAQVEVAVGDVAVEDIRLVTLELTEAMGRKEAA